MNYLVSIALTKTLPCLAEPGKIIVIGKPDRSLVEVIPYLATLPGIIAYNPEACTLTFRRQQGFLTIYPDRVYITKVEDTEQGLALLSALVDAVNATWEHRNDLIAVREHKRTPRPLDVWTLLPQSNCTQCGEATCMAFACSLLLQKRSLDECIPLQTDPLYEERRSTLSALVVM